VCVWGGGGGDKKTLAKKEILSGNSTDFFTRLSDLVQKDKEAISYETGKNCHKMGYFEK
jgi:hypothetical protein